MRIPGWALVPLLVGACSKDGPVDSVTPAAEAAPPAPPPQVLAKHIADVKRCEVVGDGTAGVVDYRMIVSASGRVQSVRVAQSPVSAAVINCSVQRARAWRFAASTERTELSFSVPYDASGSDPAPSSKKAIKGTVKHRTSALQPCFNEGLRVDPTIGGKVRYAMVIAVSGEVRSLKVEESEGSMPQAVLDCTLIRARSWVFPMNGATEGADVSFSVVFSNDRNASPPS